MTSRCNGTENGTVLVAVAICVSLSVPPDTHPIRAFPDLVGPVRLPVCDSLQTALTRPPEDVGLDVAFRIIGEIFAGMTQVLDAHLCCEPKRGTARRRGFICRKLQTNQTTRGRWG